MAGKDAPTEERAQGKLRKPVLLRVVCLAGSPSGTLSTDSEAMHF